MNLCLREVARSLMAISFSRMLEYASKFDAVSLALARKIAPTARSGERSFISIPHHTTLDNLQPFDVFFDFSQVKSLIQTKQTKRQPNQATKVDRYKPLYNKPLLPQNYQTKTQSKWSLPSESISEPPTLVLPSSGKTGELARLLAVSC